MILLNTKEHFQLVKCVQIKASDFIMFKVLHAKDIILRLADNCQILAVRSDNCQIRQLSDRTTVSADNCQ